MAENPRIEELRRRVQKDPASIAFAQLAEEYRRTGNYNEAIDICRIGLQTHPSYLSARVTLGRALVEQNDLENAAVELRYVLHHAPENLAAIRAMAEVHHRRGELTEALVFYKSALELARHDPDLEQTIDEISRTISKAPAPVAPAPAATVALTAEQASAEFLRNTFDLLEFDPIDLEPAEPEPVVAAPEPVMAVPEPVTAVPEPVMAAPEAVAVPEPVIEALDEEVLSLESEPRAAWDEEPPRLEVEEPRAAWGAGAPQASGEERGEGPPRLDDEATIPMEVSTHPALPGLERFLEAIHSYRQRTAV